MATLKHADLKGSKAGGEDTPSWRLRPHPRRLNPAPTHASYTKPALGGRSHTDDEPTDRDCVTTALLHADPPLASRCPKSLDKGPTRSRKLVSNSSSLTGHASALCPRGVLIGWFLEDSPEYPTLIRGVALHLVLPLGHRKRPGPQALYALGCRCRSPWLPSSSGGKLPTDRPGYPRRRCGPDQCHTPYQFGPHVF